MSTAKHAAVTEKGRGRTTLLVVAGIAALAILVVLGYAFFSSTDLGYSDWGPLPAGAVPAAVILGGLAILLVAARITKLVLMGKAHRRTA